MLRYLMRVRDDLAGCPVLTLALDKSKIGAEQMTLPYMYAGEKNIGAVLPMQAPLPRFCMLGSAGAGQFRWTDKLDGRLPAGRTDGSISSLRALVLEGFPCMRAHIAPALPDRYLACRKGSFGLIRRRLGPRRRAPVILPPVLAHCRSPMLLGARGSLLMDRRSGGSYSAAPRAMAQRAPYSRTPASPGPAPPWGAEADWPRGGSCAANACALGLRPW